MSKYKEITDEEKLIITAMYATGGYTCNTIGRLLGKSGSSISRFLKRSGIKIKNNRSELSRKYSINEHYFDIIDTEDKAYFLGLLYADGCNYEKENSISINLQERDVDILNKMNIAMENSKPLCKIIYDKVHPKWSNQYKISIYSKHMSSTLSALGCVGCKSLILQFPKEHIVPRNLIRHFIRGYFDGDGSFGVYSHGKQKNKTLSIGIASTLMFCSRIKEILQELNINSHIYSPPNKETKILKLSSKSAKSFLNWIYYDSTVSLDRKYSAFLAL